MEAISHAGTCLGVLCPEGVVLAAENKNTSKLLEESSQSEKIYKIDEYVFHLPCCPSLVWWLSMNMSTIHVFLGRDGGPYPPSFLYVVHAFLRRDGGPNPPSFLNAAAT